MSIDIRHIAKLSRLKIDETEMAEFEREMKAIVAMVERLPELDEEYAPESENAMKLRRDEAETDKFTKEELLANAPDVQSGCFAVPKIVEQGG